MRLQAVRSTDSPWNERKKLHQVLSVLICVLSWQAELGEQKEREHKLEQEMGAAISSRSRLEDEVANLRKKLSETQRSVQRSQRDKESYMVRTKSTVL